MTELREIYYCTVCGNLVEIINEGASALVCCHKPMETLQAKTDDTGKEKHLPIIENAPNGIIVKVGSAEHPMDEKHYIKFIEVLTKEKVLRKELSPGQKPEAVFAITKSDVAGIREYCTVHGLWQT